MSRAVAPLLALSCLAGAGCAQIFGLDDTNGDGIPRVSLTIERRSIGATIVDTPQDLSKNTATYLVANPDDPSGLTRVTASLSTADTWTADIKFATPPIQFDLPDVPTPIVRQFDFPNKTVFGLFGVLEHPNPVVADPASSFTVNVTLDTPFAAGEAFQLFTVGTWDVRGLEAPIVGATQLTPPVFPISSMSSITGRPAEKITTADAPLVLRYVGNNLTGFLDATHFDLAMANSITGALAPNPPNDMVDMTVDQQGAAMRYTTVRPAVANPTFSWDVRAAPGYQVANNNGPLLQAASLLVTDPPAIKVPFGNPFTPKYDWKSILTWSTQATRTFTPPGQLLVATLVSGMFQRAFPAPGLAMKLPAGLPQSIALDDTQLVMDGLTIAAPTRAATVSFVVDPPTNTMYQLQLFEIVPNAANTALELHLAYATSGTQARFVMPPEIFKTGKTYTLRAIAVQGGYPAIGTADLRSRDLPIAISFLDSGVFQVMP